MQAVGLKDRRGLSTRDTVNAACILAGPLLALANKALVGHVPNTPAVLFFQALVATTLFLLTPAFFGDVVGALPLRLSAKALKRWFPAALAFILMVLSAMEALRRVSVTSLVLLGDLSLVVVDATWRSLFAGVGGNSTGGSDHAAAAGATVLAHQRLWGMVVGAALFSAGDLAFDATGYAWLFVHVGMQFATSVLISRSNVDEDLPKSFRMAYFRTILSLPVIAAVGFFCLPQLSVSANGVEIAVKNRSIVGAMLVSGLILYFAIMRDTVFSAASSSSPGSRVYFEHAETWAKITACLFSDSFYQPSLGMVSCIGIGFIAVAANFQRPDTSLIIWPLGPSLSRANNHDSNVDAQAAQSPARGGQFTARNWLQRATRFARPGMSARFASAAGLAVLCTCVWICSLSVLVLRWKDGTVQSTLDSEQRQATVISEHVAAFSKAPAAPPAGGSKHVAMRAVVMTGGTRKESLQRLLYSLALIVSDGDRIDTDVWIDIPDGDTVSSDAMSDRQKLEADIQKLGTSGVYRNGLIRAHVWPQHAGMRGQWLDAWDASIPGGLTEDTEEIGLLLEDDLELSPYAWRWLKSAHAQYGQDRRIAGFSLQRVQLCAAESCHRDLNGGPDGAGGGFLYPLIGTWGYSPTAKSYAKFRRWYYSLPDDYKPYVEGLLPTTWYKKFEKQGTEKKRMWEMHHLKYTDTNEDKYTVYVKCPGSDTLAVNHRELGLNYHKKEESPHKMMVDWTPDIIRFSKNPLVLNYKAEVVQGERVV